VGSFGWKAEIPVVCVLQAQNHRDRRLAASWLGDLELCRIAAKTGRLTPVPMVAMDCGLLESRLGRLDTLSRGGSGAMVSNPAVRTPRFD
jgi:hypothetical protein